ncbi:MAG: aldolase catalytic domain-containing protein [Ruminococcus sp.]|nr:aldolase catalytic domain-containing protein [Ruminococcus sp.]
MSKGNLLSVREDVRVLDATLRDGGLCNDFFFDDKFVSDLYHANIGAGVDYMEFGYKANKDIFSPEKFGKWKFCNDEDIRAVVGENKTPMKIAVMADVGRCDYKRDIHPRDESPIDMVRVATYINTIPAALDIVEHCHKMGYETAINIMAISKERTEDLREALDIFGKSPVDVFYIVDSYGAFYPEQIRRYSQMYLEYAEKYGKNVGIHAHDNQSLAFANTIDALQEGVSFLDVTSMGMGRGAGNCRSELLVGFLKNPKYRTEPLYNHIEKYYQQLKDQGIQWGFDVPYIITGQRNSHPRSAIAFQKDHRTDYTNFFYELMDMD